MRILRAVFAAALAAAVFWGLHFRHGLLPPLGKLVNPFAGFWRNGDRPDPALEVITLPGLRERVDVVWDDRRVPHIFARNDHDLYFAQGYLVARDRLWQMEFQTLYAAGRLSEVVGPAGLEHDRLQRRLGMTWAAERSAQAMAGDPVINGVVQAYADGVNSFIAGLRPHELPVEYKILDFRPEPWTKLKAALLLKYMAWTLSGHNTDLSQTRTRDALGEDFVRSLYPDFPPLLEPIIPRGADWGFQAAPQAADGAGEAPRTPQPPASVPAARDGEADPRGVGSNNWAVAGSRTRTGFPILCNDPHLNLTLPSIWYELQLTAPGVNVRGVTFAGAPGVIIGFNRDAAWGMTNLGADVLDWHRVRFRDSSRREYAYGGGWRPVIARNETIKVRGRRAVRDRVLYTHHGPVVRLEEEEAAEDWIPAGAAMRWAAHDPSVELKAVYLLNRGSSYGDFLEALRHFACPAQNFVYADAGGDIALWSNGRLPMRSPGQGRFLLDGSSPGDDWPGWIPWERNPHVLNPERGFVSSANQHPADETYPYRLGWDFSSFERGARINEVLAAGAGFTPRDMEDLQRDGLSLRARMLLPRLLSALRAATLAPEERRALEALERWDGVFAADSVAATLFDALWRALNERTWNDEKEAGLESVAWPMSNVFLDLALNRPDSPFFDDKTTPGVERFDDLILPAFQTALGRLGERLGPFGGAWRWGRARGTEIGHLGRLPGFGSGKLETPGGPAVVNATQRSSGPSWRMTVALGPEIRAWGILPGGQSGNPGSRFYDNAVADWVAGKTYELLFLESPDDPVPGAASRTELRGAR
ncbi:MAG: penicillin acylase family protein [Candidatus Aminicenantes bacterium]|nr:penicillin acylase family protein [Candidatus Aminicenantes bacterium]